jgi:hypothetical protein
VALGEVTVTRPGAPFRLTPPHPGAADFGPLRLLGYDLDRTAAVVGEALTLSLFWRAEQAPDVDLEAEARLLDAAGAAALRWPVEPANGYPTGLWQAGDEWRGQARLRLPATLPAGRYTLVVAAGSDEAGANAAALAQLEVSAPERSFAPPAVEHPAQAEFAAGAPVARLAGYTLERGVGGLRLTLAWEALGSPEASYHVFVHLGEPGGRVWTQSDAAPAGWSRPTTGWITGEFITDMHALALPADLPAGEYDVWVGLYDPATGQRLAVAGEGAEPDNRLRLETVSLP